MLGDPFVLEQGKSDFVAPDSLEPPIADQVRLAAHAEAVGEPKRGSISSVHTGCHPVQAELIEGEMEHGMGRPRGIPVTGVTGMEYPADFAASMRNAVEKKTITSPIMCPVSANSAPSVKASPSATIALRDNAPASLSATISEFMGSNGTYRQTSSIER